jgi:amidophosphoribosyltransferase
MGGFFGVVAKEDCVTDLFFGTDYHSHLGTMRGGMAVLSDKGFQRAIHDISNSQFRTKFENDFRRFEGKAGSVSSAIMKTQPLIISSNWVSMPSRRWGDHQYTAAGERTLRHASCRAIFRNEPRRGSNPTELVATLINSHPLWPKAYGSPQQKIEGSCSLLILTLEGDLYAARDRFGRTPVVLGQKEGAVAATWNRVASPISGMPSPVNWAPARWCCARRWN